MEEPETRMKAKPEPRAKPGIEQRRDLGMGFCEAPQRFEKFKLEAVQFGNYS